MNQKAAALVLGVVAITWYYLCLFQIGLDLGSSGTFRDFMSLSITTIGAALATFVGGLLGVRQVASVVERTETPVNQNQMPAMGDPPSGVPQQQVDSAAQQQGLFHAFATTGMQWAATILYIASLLLALWFWYRTGNETDPALTNLGKTLLGLMGGALAIVLNAPKET
jgi:hypothetical protein